MTVRFGAGAYVGMGVVTPYATTGKNSDIDFLIRAQDGTDAISYKRTLLDPKDLSSYDEQFDQVQAGEETVEGTMSDKATFSAMQDILRLMCGSNPTVSGANPYTYAFTGSSKPTRFSDPNHYQIASSGRNWVVEMFRGTVVRSTTETQADTGTITVGTSGGAITLTRASGAWSSTAYVRGALVTISGSAYTPASPTDNANGVYVVESATYTAGGTVTLRKSSDGWYVTDAIPTGSMTTLTISAVYYESVFYQGCNLKSLKLDWERNDYVQRAMDFVGTTANRGASSHSYLQSKTVGPAQLRTATVAVAATTITRDLGSWITDGFVIGGSVTIHASDQAANVGVTATISALTATVMTVSTSAFTADADDTTLRVSGSAFTGSSRVYGGTPATQPKRWLTDYVRSNPGQGATKFLTLGGTEFICRSASLTIEEPLEDRYDIGQSSSEQRLPEKKRMVKLEVEIETNDDKFLEVLRSPSTKAFGASGGDYTGINQVKILGADSTSGYSITFLFPYLVLDGDSETRVEGIGPTTAKFTLKAMSDDVNNPAYTVTVVNGDVSYRT